MCSPYACLSSCLVLLLNCKKVCAVDERWESENTVSAWVQANAGRYAARLSCICIPVYILLTAYCLSLQGFMQQTNTGFYGRTHALRKSLRHLVSHFDFAEGVCLCICKRVERVFGNTFTVYQNAKIHTHRTHTHTHIYTYIQICTNTKLTHAGPIVLAPAAGIL